jgi:mono/diheme cytochrome c family protein
MRSRTVTEPVNHIAGGAVSSGVMGQSVIKVRAGVGGMVLCAVMVLGMVVVGADQKGLPAAAERKVDFEKDVAPIFARSCLSCHGPEKQKSSYRLDDRGVALKGGELGKAIVPGDGAGSRLIQYVAGAHEEIRMPPKGEMLSAQEVGMLRAWIDEGAVWPDKVGAGAQQKHWSLRELVKLEVPAVKGWGRTPVDAFVLAKLSEMGLAPSPEADRRTLIRRVHFDLVGLPPSPEEIDAFVKDPQPEGAAWEKVVDRLLGSPRYGERWARHWMDVVHYAETHGHDEDKPRPNAWPYRDYLIAAFNEDRPYARFVAEQIAGDVLWPDEPRATVATAFLAVGPWDQSSQMGIQDGTLDKQVARYLDRDDMIATAMSTFVSSTVHCARCHQHKFDPISQEDYYALQAVFAGVDRVDRAYDADPNVHVARRELLKRKKELEAGALVLSPEIDSKVAAWENRHAEKAKAWVVLKPTEAKSSAGSTLTVQPDGSVLAGGTRPEKDAYTITAGTELVGVTAVRVEVLADDSLPAKGPGRADNGNLHLTEFKVIAAPRGKPAATQPVKIAAAAADFDQQDWGVAKAIDEKSETAWGIHPQEGKSHVAVFSLKEAVLFDGGTQFSFVLGQEHGRGHLIGRPRISVTTAPLPVKVPTMPDSIAAILSIAPDRRTEAQNIELARHVLKTEVEEKLAAIPAPSIVYAVASDFEAKGNFKPAVKPRAVSVLRRGDIRQPVEAASPGALSCVAGVEPRFKLSDSENEATRRAALARWVVDPKNVLTWRSIANRVWHHHFGRGICDTPNDLGRMGGVPSHPELLDWLAVTFRDDMGGSLKKLHRLIVTSAAYRQSSRDVESAAKVDAENRLLWRMNRTRLDAEQVRDAILSVSGKLNLTMGGPSVKQFVESKGIHETPNVDYGAFDVDSPGSYRRSVYRFVFRTIPDPLMRSLDCPDASQLTAARQSSVTAVQALAMLNNAFVVRQSEHVAARLAKGTAELEEQVRVLFELALGRPATSDEIEALGSYARKHGMANACRMILNSNEFMFVN